MIIPQEAYAKSISSSVEAIRSTVPFEALVRAQVVNIAPIIGRYVGIPPGTGDFELSHVPLMALYSVSSLDLYKQFPWMESAQVRNLEQTVDFYERNKLLEINYKPPFEDTFNVNSRIYPDIEHREHLENQDPWLFSYMHAQVADAQIAKAKELYRVTKHEYTTALVQEAFIHMIHSLELAGIAKIVDMMDSGIYLEKIHDQIKDFGLDEAFATEIYPRLQQRVRLIAVNPLELARYMKEWGLADDAHLSAVTHLSRHQ